MPVENRFGLHPAADPDGEPAPILAEYDLDRLGLVKGVTTFNLHPHLPHLERIGGAIAKLDVLARQRVDATAPPHPFTADGRWTFDAIAARRVRRKPRSRRRHLVELDCRRCRELAAPVGERGQTLRLKLAAAYIRQRRLSGRDRGPGGYGRVNEQDMDLRKLRYFLAVAAESNFGRAAARLHMTQPALSRQIQSLEAEIGVRLFERDRHGTRLTSAGEQFRKDAEQLLDLFVAAQRRARQAAR